MNYDQARLFLERLYGTKEDELDCAGLLEVIDRYVELSELGDDRAVLGPQVPEHLFQCPDCHELVQTVATLVRMEATGELPAIDDLWAELRAATSDAAESGASRRAAPARAAGARASPWWRLLGRFRPRRPANLALAAMAGALALTAAAWVQSLERERDAAEVMDAIGQSAMVRSAPMAGGLARVFFDPRDRFAVVHMDGPAPVTGAMRCWLRRADGTTVSAEAEPYEGGDGEWWVIESAHSLDGFAYLSMASVAGSEPLVELPLRAASSR